MINLKVLNKALTDPSITDAEFRLLYLIANNISMGKTDTKEIYNGFLMDKLHLSERQIQRLTKSLDDKHYIIKRGIGKSVRRNGNLYSLPNDCETIPSEIDHDIHGDMADDKNDTPYMKQKENKNILVNTSVQSEEWKPNLRVCEEIDDIPFGIDEAMITVSETEETKSVECIEEKNNNETDMSYTCYTEEDIRAYSLQVAEEWKQIEEVHRQNGEYQKIGVWVGKILSRGYDLLRGFERAKAKEGASAYASEISKLIDNMNKAVEADILTQGQYGAFKKFVNSYNRAADNKEAYFKRGKQMKSKQPQRMEKGSNTLIQPSGEDIGKAAPRPHALTDDDIQRMAKEVRELYETWDFQRMTEAEERYLKAIKEDGTEQQMRLYKKLTA